MFLCNDYIIQGFSLLSNRILGSNIVDRVDWMSYILPLL